MSWHMILCIQIDVISKYFWISLYILGLLPSACLESWLCCAGCTTTSPESKMAAMIISSLTSMTTKELDKTLKRI